MLDAGFPYFLSLPPSSHNLPLINFNDTLPCVTLPLLHPLLSHPIFPPFFSPRTIQSSSTSSTLGARSRFRSALPFSVTASVAVDEGGLGLMGGAVLVVKLAPLVAAEEEDVEGEVGFWDFFFFFACFIEEGGGNIVSYGGLILQMEIVDRRKKLYC